MAGIESKSPDRVNHIVVAATVIAVCGLGIAGIVGSMKIGIWGRQGPGSGLFPLLASILIVVCTLPRLFTLHRFADDSEHPTNWRRLGFYLLSLLAFVLLFQPAGFPISSLVALMIILAVAERQPLLVSIAFTLAMTIVSVILFDYVLSVPIPWGPLAFLRFWM